MSPSRLAVAGTLDALHPDDPDAGREVHRLVLGSEPGLVVHLLTLGATVARLEVADGRGTRRDVTLGHPSVADYRAGTDYLGGTIGRFANRIAGGRFTLDGREVVVGAHDRGNHLHGGPHGFDTRVWEVAEAGDDHAVLTLRSPDGDQGFPGTVEVSASFVVEGDRLSLDLAATTDAPTLVSMTSHLYLNLDGQGAGTVDDHLLQVAASRFTPTDDTGIPLGPHEEVAGTPFDLREPTRVGDAVRRQHPQLCAGHGIDHNYVVDGQGRRTVARLSSPRSGLAVDVVSDQPGLQVYTGNFLDGTAPSSAGGVHRQGDGLALEPQLFPDSPHHPAYPSAVLRPGEQYAAHLAWAFSRSAPAAV